MNRIIVISVLVTAGVLATYVSGSLQLTSEVTPGGTFLWTYGFPLPWVRTVGAYCTSPLSSFEGYTVTTYGDSAYAPCLKSFATSYDWILFTGDVLFYSGIGYGLILAVRKTWKDALKLARKQAEQLHKGEIPDFEDNPESSVSGDVGT